MKRISTVVAGLCLAPSVAAAGGMSLHTRGVRPTARGGAFVAGADDLGALWFNPAGLANLAGGDEKVSLLLDAALVHQAAEYDRIDSGGNQAGTARSSAPGKPVPSIAASYDLGGDGVIAAGVFAPYAGLATFEEDGPQRYSVIDMSHSVIAAVAIGVGWDFGSVRIGATVQNWISGVNQTAVVSGCPSQTICAPEDPEFDALVQIDQNDPWNPSASAGVQVDVHRSVTVGLSVQAPIRLEGDATLRTRLPSSGFYDGASVSGDQVRLGFTMAPSARLGVEVRPNERWRVEVAGDVEKWSMHEEMTITPYDMKIEDQAGVGTYELGPMVVPRHYRDTWAASLGVEGQPSAERPLRVLAGYTYETAAAPDAYLSALTFDGTKHLLSAGAGYVLGAYTIDAMVAYGIVGDRTVSMDEARSTQLSPVRDPGDEPLEVFVNAGEYRQSWLLAGVGVRTAF